MVLSILTKRTKLFVLIVSVSAIYLFTLNPNWKPTWDSAIYISLGKSLITGCGYTYMGYSHIKYPPVFPLLLSPIIGLFGLNYLFMRLTIVLMAICSIGLSYLICRRLFDPTQETYVAEIVALSVALLSAFSYALLSEATRILSDFPYMFFSFLALIFIDKYSKTKTSLNITAVLTVIFITLSSFTRLIGLSLVIASISYLFWTAEENTPAVFQAEQARTKNQRTLFSLVVSSKLSNVMRKAVFIGFITIASISIWIVRNQLVSESFPPELHEGMSYEREFILKTPHSSYSSVAKNLLVRVLGNLRYYGLLMANIISGKNIQSRVGEGIVSLILLFGFLIRFIRNPTIIEFYVFFYMLVYLVWPAHQGERFLVPIIPFLFLYLLYLSKLAVELLAPMLKKISNVSVTVSLVVIIITCVLIGLSVFPAIRVVANEHRTQYYRGEKGDYINAILWVKENTSPESVIVTNKAPWAYLLSNRKSFSLSSFNDKKKIIAFIRKYNVTHVVTTPFKSSDRYISETISLHSDKFTEIHKVGASKVYRFNVH